MCKTKKNSYSIPTTSTPNHYAQRIGAMSVRLLNFHTTEKSPPVGKYCLCFHNDGKSVDASKCVKSRIMNKLIYCFILIDTFEQLCVALKGVLQSPRLKYHVKTVVIDQ